MGAAIQQPATLRKMLRILYWNVHRKKTNMAQALDDDGEYDMLALQEVWLNRDPAKEGETYCPRSSRYNIIHKTGQRYSSTSGSQCQLGQLSVGTTGAQLC